MRSGLLWCAVAIVAVEEYVKRHQRAAQVEALSTRIAEEVAELLRRLA